MPAHLLSLLQLSISSSIGSPETHRQAETPWAASTGTGSDPQLAATDFFR